MTRIIGLGFFVLLLLAAPVLAAETADDAVGEAADENAAEEVDKEDRIVVTAARLATPEKEVASSVTVVTGEEIERKGITLVSDALRGKPALDVARTGGPGGSTSLFIRGAKSEHTLVLIDGIEMNDPVGTGRTFDFANLTTENIERVEVLKGAQSTLYGSDAMGGVVNIITKSGREEPGFTASFEGGSFDTFRASAALRGGTDLYDYSLAAVRFDTDGISAASEAEGNTEEDGYENTSVTAGAGLRPLDVLELGAVVKYVDAHAEIDNSGGAGGDDPNNTLDTMQVFLRTDATLTLAGGLWEQRLGYSLSDHQRENVNPTDADHPASSEDASYDGTIEKVDWQHNLYLTEAHTVTLGLEHEEETAQSRYHSVSGFGPFTSVFERRTARTNSAYVQEHLTWRDTFFATLGARVDEHDRFGTETTWRAAAAYKLHATGTRVRGAVGTAFKAPSLFQLFSQYGDPDLRPEESTSWDVGLEQEFAGGRLALEVTYFRNDFDNLIDFDTATSMYSNIGEATTQGVEVGLSARPSENLTVAGAYTYTDTEDLSTGDELLRRARNKASVDFIYDFYDRLGADLSVVYIGEREDKDFTTFPAQRVELSGYTLVDVSARYDLTDNIRLTGRVENLFDTDYEEVKGFGTPGLAVYAGARIEF